MGRCPTPHAESVMNIDKIKDLLREIVQNQPYNHCADDGDICLFCGVDWDFDRTKHGSTCWLVRVEKAYWELEKKRA